MACELGLTSTVPEPFVTYGHENYSAAWLASERSSALLLSGDERSGVGASLWLLPTAARIVGAALVEQQTITTTLLED
jgi:hypothetical protein